MPSYETAPHKRWEPPLCWAKVLLNSPRVGCTYNVRYPRSEPFKAFLDEDHRWYMDNDRQVMIPVIALEYQVPLTPSVRL